jgi:hypothetical protein
LLASDVAAGPNDLLVALDGENEASLAAAPLFVKVYASSAG